MTSTSALFGGGGTGLPSYLSSRIYACNPSAEIQTNAQTLVNTLSLLPFYVRERVTLDGVAWYRNNTNASNVYVGILDSDGDAITDCAVDSNITAGIHIVSTTNVALDPSSLYYFALNASVAVAARTTGILTGSDADYRAASDSFEAGGIPSGLTTITANQAYLSKSLTAALITGSNDLSTFSTTQLAGWGGFEVQ
ncbi:MAG: hypothetical protein AAGA08_16880 [Pseudomonadota bacterium]